MNGPIFSASDDAALDRVLASYRTPAMPEALIDRIMDEALRPDRIPTMPPAAPARLRTRRWMRPSILAGLVSINLLAAGALAAVVGQGGVNLQKLAALPAQVLHHIVHPHHPHVADATVHLARNTGHTHRVTTVPEAVEPAIQPDFTPDATVLPDHGVRPMPARLPALRMLYRHPLIARRMERAVILNHVETMRLKSLAVARARAGVRRFHGINAMPRPGTDRSENMLETGNAGAEKPVRPQLPDPSLRARQDPEPSQATASNLPSRAVEPGANQEISNAPPNMAEIRANRRAQRLALLRQKIQQRRVAGERGKHIRPRRPI